METLVENLAKSYWPSVKSNFNETSGSINRRIRHIREKAEALSFKNSMLAQQGRHPADLISRLGDFEDRMSLSAPRSTRAEDAELPQHNLPFRGFPHFWGREDILKKIGEELDHKEKDRKLRSLAIWGIGGVGKSQTAYAYARGQIKQGIDAVFWVKAETELQLKEAYTDIAVSLKLEGASLNGTQAQNRYVVMKWLARTQATWLLIFDNVEEPALLADYWPASSNGSILITCRSSTVAASPAASSLEIRSFEKEEGGKLLLTLLKKDPHSSIAVPVDEKDATVVRHVSAFLNKQNSRATLRNTACFSRHICITKSHSVTKSSS